MFKIQSCWYTSIYDVDHLGLSMSLSIYVNVYIILTSILDMMLTSHIRYNVTHPYPRFDVNYLHPNMIFTGGIYIYKIRVMVTPTFSCEKIK